MLMYSIFDHLYFQNAADNRDRDADEPRHHLQPDGWNGPSTVNIHVTNVITAATHAADATEPHDADAATAESAATTDANKPTTEDCLLSSYNGRCHPAPQYNQYSQY